MMGSNLPLLLGWLLAGVATNLPTLYAARIMWGCATGMQFATVPLYIGEIAEVFMNFVLFFKFISSKTQTYYFTKPPLKWNENVSNIYLAILPKLFS